MDAPATISVTAGPDTGKAFPLTSELVHIGRGSDNQVVLSDSTLSEHQASIVRRSGRYAIYAPAAGTVQVDGAEIPPEKWVWLPQSATVRLGSQTVFSLDAPATNGTPKAADSTPTPVTGRTSKTSVPGAAKLRKKVKISDSRSQVARFLSDRSGEPLVKLGEDGQLPALELAELADEQPRERRQKAESNPLLLYALLGGSFLLSLGMLFIDPEGGGTSSSADRTAARAVVQEYLGTEGSDLEPYQRLLRQALVNHSQGNVRAEQDAYRRVLRILNSSDIRDPQNLNGLTGKLTGRGRASDEELRSALMTLLSE
jgi:pSer/pThr/pTyr-binding forkhead associated (FHA) protein